MTDDLQLRHHLILAILERATTAGLTREGLAHVFNQAWSKAWRLGTATHPNLHTNSRRGALQTLIHDGLVEKRQDRPPRYYLTDQGRRKLEGERAARKTAFLKGQAK